MSTAGVHRGLGADERRNGGGSLAAPGPYGLNDVKE